MPTISSWLDADSLEGFPELTAHERLEIRRQGGALFPILFPGDGTILQGAPTPLPAPAPSDGPDLRDPVDLPPWRANPNQDPHTAWQWIRAATARRLGLARRWRLLRGRAATYSPDPLPVLMLASPADLASLHPDGVNPAELPWAAGILPASSGWGFCTPPTLMATALGPDPLLEHPHEAVLVPTIATARLLRRTLARPRATYLMSLEYLMICIAGEEGRAWTDLGALGSQSTLLLEKRKPQGLLALEAGNWFANILCFVFGVEEQRLFFT